jgi:hypothetical protein
MGYGVPCVYGAVAACVGCTGLKMVWAVCLCGLLLRLAHSVPSVGCAVCGLCACGLQYAIVSWSYRSKYISLKEVPFSTFEQLCNAHV